MKMIKGVVILALLMTLTLCAFNIAAASSLSTSQKRSDSSTYYIKIDPSYPRNPTVTQNIRVDGTLMKGDTPVADLNPQMPLGLYHGEYLNNVPNPTMWKLGTNHTGGFHDLFQFGEPGRHDLIYTYVWGDGLADFCVSDIISIYAVKAA